MESEVGMVPLNESGVEKELDSNREILLKRGGTDGVVEGDEEGAEDARITKLPHDVCKQKSLFKTSFPCVTNFSYTIVK